MHELNAMPVTGFLGKSPLYFLILQCATSFQQIRPS